MQVERHWWVKKNPAMHLLDIAIFLALFRQIRFDDLLSIGTPMLYHDLIESAGPLVGLSPMHHYPHQLEGQIYNSKMVEMDYSDVMHDYRTIMNDAQRRLPLSAIEHLHTANDTLHSQNITAMMLRFSREEQDNSYLMYNNSEAERNILNLVNSTRLDIFNDTISSAHENISNLLLNNEQHTEEYNNADDIRWRCYLNQNDTTTNKSKHCDDDNMGDDCVDFGFLDDSEVIAFPKDDTRIRTTSILSEESGIDVIDDSEAQPPSISHDHTYNSPLNLMELISAIPSVLPNIEELIPDSMNGSLSLHRVSTDSLQDAYNVSSEDADLMQIMYEQDIDLGIDWQHLNQPVKQIKEVDEIEKEKNNTDIEFFIDGETGEQIPIIRNTAPQTADILHDQFMSTNTNALAPNNTINIDECLEILEGSIDDIQPTQQVNQSTIDERDNIVDSLTSLIDENEANITTSHTNEDIWQHIADLSELTGMDLQSRQMQQPQTQNIINTNVSLTNATLLQPTPMLQHKVMPEPLTNFNPSSFVQHEHEFEPMSLYEPQMTQNYPMSNYSPSYNPPLQSPTHFISSPMNSDDGIPMDGISFSSMPSSPELQEQNYLLNRLNNYRFGMDPGDSPPYGGNPPILSSLPEPGQGFFDSSPKHDVTSGLSELVSMNSSVPSFSNNLNGPYINPTQAPYPPPPLHSTPPPVVTFPDEIDTLGGSTVDKNAISDFYESDSGISLDQSPSGFGFATLNVNDDSHYNGVSSIKIESAHDQSFHFSDLKAVEHNHTYNGTAGKTKISRKKLEKSNQSRESRDERKARELNLPFTLDEIILSPVEDYNEMLARTPLSPAQQALIKDIRRRGKNKVAAQNCRKRKIETITNMEEDVDVLRERKQQLVDEQNELESTKENIKMRYNSLYQRIFSSLRDETGRPYDPSHFRLEQVEGAVLIVPRLRRNELLNDNQSMEQDECGEVNLSIVKLEKQD